MCHTEVVMRYESFMLDHGEITIQWPSEMSAESFEDFSDWLDILKRKIKRSVKGAEEGPSSPHPVYIDPPAGGNEL